MAEISLDDPQPTFILKPCATAKARYLDPKGKPVKKGLMFGVNMVATPGESKYSRDPTKRHLLLADEDNSVNFDQAGPRPLAGTDANGVEHYQYLVPGATYRLHNINASGKWVVEKEFIAKSGELHDLGDVTVDLEK
jgi:hypothetical protein